MTITLLGRTDLQVVAAVVGPPGPAGDGIAPHASRALFLASSPPATQLTASYLQGDQRLDFVRDATGTTATTANGVTWSPADAAYPEHFGADGGGTVNDTVALNLWAAASGTKSAPGIYGIAGTVTIPENARIKGVLRLNWRGLATGTPLVVEDNVKIGGVEFTTANTVPEVHTITIGTGFQCDKFLATAQVDCTGTLVSMNEKFLVDDFQFVNFSRPLYIFGNLADDAPAEGGYIGRVACAPHIRGVRVDYLNDWQIGEIICDGASAAASATPGHNGVLIQSCSDWHIGYLRATGTGEHAFRIGGTVVTGFGSTGWSVGTVEADTPGGCAFKINDGTTRVTDFSIDRIIHRGALPDDAGRNKETFRATNFARGSVGSIFVRKIGGDFSTFGPVALNDGNSLTIGSVDCEDHKSEAFHIRGGQDDVGPGTVSGITVGYLRAVGGSRFCDIATTAAVSNIHILDGYFDQGDELYDISGPPASIANITVAGYAAASIATDGVAAGNIAHRLRLPGGRSMVSDAMARAHGTVAIDVGVFDPADVVEASQGGIYLQTPGLTAASGLLGSAVSFARPGSSGRRGAAIVAVQTGADVQDTGLAFYSASGSAGTDAISLRATRRHSGDLRFENANRGVEFGASGPRIFGNTGSPEGVHTAPVGSMFLRSNGGTGTTLYVKESGTGNTGWVAK